MSAKSMMRLFPLQHFAFGIAHQQAVEQDVLASGQFVMKARAQLDERRQRSGHFDRAAVG